MRKKKNTQGHRAGQKKGEKRDENQSQWP